MPYLLDSEERIVPTLDDLGLRKAVAIPSVSAQDELRPEVFKVSTLIHMSICIVSNSCWLFE